MVRRLAAWTLTLLASCTCPQAKQREPPPPHEPGPTLAPMTGPDNPTGAGLLPGGPVVASIRLSALPGALVPEALRSIDHRRPITATFLRPTDRGHHHRIAWTQASGTSWRDVLPEGSPCTRFDDAECLDYPGATAAVISSGDQVRLDLFTGRAPEGDVQIDLAPGGALPLRGEVALRGQGLHEVLEYPGPAAIASASFQLAEDEDAVRIRLGWTLDGPPEEAPSTAGAPSWDALCRDAVACIRTGPWPDVASWLADLRAVELPDDPRLTALVLWGSAWPHLLAARLRDARSRLPEPAQGFFDTAISSLGEVAFAGGRLEQDGTALAFVRIPSAQVNFTASLLAWSGHDPQPVMLDDGTEVSWAPLTSAGIVLALDDGDAPAMGWIAYASDPEAFTWIRTAPRTAAGRSALFLHANRLAPILALLPAPIQTPLRPIAERSITLRLEHQGPELVARADLGASD